MKNKGNIWNKVLNIPSTHDPSLFHPDEDAKHKYTSNSDDGQKGNKKQGQKRKVETKDAASEDNVKKTKQDRGKGRGKTSNNVQPLSAFSSRQAAEGQGTLTPDFQPGSTRTGYIYTDFQPGSARTSWSKFTIRATSTQCI